MDILEKFIRKVAYKFPKGYPDINNPEDRALLFELLDYDTLLNETQLSRGQLKKYDTRISKFVDQFLDGRPFESHSKSDPIKVDTLKINGKEYTLEDEREDIFQAIKSGSGTILAKGTSGGESVEVSTSDFVKTADYGGKGAGSGTEKEDMALADANSNLKSLNEGKPVNLLVNGVIYSDIVGAITVPKTPKADFAFVDKGGSPKIFISHKDGSRPNDFQQYGGLTHSKVINHPEVQSFVEAVKNNLEDDSQMERGSGFRRRVEDPELIRVLVYGVDFKSKTDYGINNVQVLYQGPLKYQAVSGKLNTFSVSSNHTINNPEVPQEGYYPYFYVTFRTNRNQFGVKDSRFGVYTQAWRPTSKEI